MDEGTLVELIRARDQRGAEELLRHYGPLLRYVISPILPDRQDAEECVSEAVMRAWEHIGLFDPSRGTLNGWLTAIARNTALNRARDTRQEAESGLSDDIPSSEPTPEEDVIKKERQRELRKALSCLAEADRILFYRKYYYLQSTAQIASELGMTERAVEGRLYRLKRRLRKLLGGEGYG